MTCCGQKRASVRTRGAAPAGSRTVASRVTPRAGRFGRADGVTLRYVGSGPMTMRGPRTGRVYSCSVAGAAMLVDRLDVEALLRTRLFTRRHPW